VAAPPPPPGTVPLAPFLAAVQLADSAFPSGRYTLSHGLESFVQSGDVTARSGVRGLWSLLSDQLEHGIATADGVAVAWAHRAVSQAPDSEGYDEQLALEADLRLTSVKLGREAREASARTGRGVLGTAVGSFAGPALTAYARLVHRGAAPGNGAVVTGILTAELAVPLLHSVATELYAFAAGWLNATVRLGVADHRVAQAVLHRCGPVIDRAARRACETGLDDMSSSTPLVDVMSMRHEQATLRLFMS
jgi:urease accessory protein